MCGETIIKYGIAFAIIVMILLYRYVQERRRRQCNLPPLVVGSLPLLGHITCIDRYRPHLTLTEWANKYGAIFRFRVLTRDVIVLNTSDVIHDALVTQDCVFAGRPPTYRIQYGFHFADDIIFGTYSSKWLDMKRKASRTLREFTSGVSRVDEIVAFEMITLIDAIRRKDEFIFDPTLILQTAVFNAISASVTGRRYHHNDQEMLDYQLITRLFSESCSPVNGVEIDLFPWLRFFARNTFEKLDKARTLLDALVDKEIDAVRKNYNGRQPTCFLEGLLKLREDDSSSSCKFPLKDSDVRAIFIDILVAGTITTSVALRGLVLLVSCNDVIQTRLRHEMDVNVGHDRLPCISDRKTNHYMEAAILETLRFISHVPLSLPHTTIKASVLAGYDIPKDTTILLNLWNIHHDPTVWKDPWTFHPERFLDEHGRMIATDHPLMKSFMPFGKGRRKCIGERLSHERLFLFASCIIQNFILLPPTDGTTKHLKRRRRSSIDDVIDNESSYSSDSETLCDPRQFNLGLILEPKPFKMRVIRR